jgi:hypothetical protein
MTDIGSGTTAEGAPVTRVLTFDNGTVHNAVTWDGMLPDGLVIEGPDYLSKTGTLYEENGIQVQVLGGATNFELASLGDGGSAWGGDDDLELTLNVFNMGYSEDMNHEEVIRFCLADGGAFSFEQFELPPSWNFSANQTSYWTSSSGGTFSATSGAGPSGLVDVPDQGFTNVTYVDLHVSGYNPYYMPFSTAIVDNLVFSQT